MQSKVYPRYKTKYRVANWAAYNQALVRRGDVTVWLSSEAVAAWTPRRSGQRGGQRRYSDLAIETALTLRLLYHLPLRQAEGFLHALFGMMRLDLSVASDDSCNNAARSSSVGAVRTSGTHWLCQALKICTSYDILDCRRSGDRPVKQRQTGLERTRLLSFRGLHPDRE